MDRPNKNVVRGEATRSQLIVIATRLFAESFLDQSLEIFGGLHRVRNPAKNALQIVLRYLPE